MATKTCIQGHQMDDDTQFCVQCGGYSNANNAADITAKQANQRTNPALVVTATRKH